MDVEGVSRSWRAPHLTAADSHARATKANAALSGNANGTPYIVAASAHKPLGQAAFSSPSDRSTAAAGWVAPRPRHDVLRIFDDFAVFEDEYRNEALAGQPLDLLATARDVGQRRQTVGLHHLR